MAVAPPNYTQVPNQLIAELAHMPEAAVRVALVIARKTFGYHKTRDRISLSQLVEGSGLSRQGVINGIEWLMTKNHVARTPIGQSYFYELLVNEVDQSTELTSQASGLALVNEVDQKQPKLVNEVDTQKKKRKKTIKERFSAANAAHTATEIFPTTADVSETKNTTTATATASVASTHTGEPLGKPQKTTTLYGDIFKAVSDICVLDTTAKSNAGKVGKAAVWLDSKGVKPNQVCLFGEWFKANHWKGQRGDVPGPQDIFDNWRKFAEGHNTAVRQTVPANGFAKEHAEPKSRLGKGMDWARK